MPRTITETECLSPMFGGYISIRKDGNEFYIASVPSFVLGADRYRESVSENDEKFKDDEGNEFEISIWSSTVGVDWKLSLSAKNGDDEVLEKRISMEYQNNDY